MNTEEGIAAVPPIMKEEVSEDAFEFEAVSCFVIPHFSRPRRWTIQLIKWPYPFEEYFNVSLIN